ncbi:hypothetical protein GGI11_002704 [Coemansia sp. RSA 2049]|nr:hypothetical protein GGI11_002704 [Coemansia sp. RSA 2049]
MSPGSSSGAENSIAAGRKCGCGSVCWLCYSWNNNNNNNTNNTNNNGGGLAYAANQLHSSSLHLQLSDQAAAPLAHHPAGESNGGGAATLLAAGDSSRGGWQEPETFSQQTKSSTGAAAVIRPLRSWSSSEKRGPSLEEPPRSRGPRRFSAAGPPPLAAAGPGGTNNSSTGSTSSAKSAVGSQRSHVLASLHTWAEEEDELADGAMGAALVHSRASTGSSRLFQQAHGHAEYTRTQSTRYMHRQQHSSGSIGTSTTNGGSRFVVRHNVPEPTFGFVEVGSSSGSSTGSGGPLPPSSVLAAGAGNAAAATAATAAARNTNHQRLRTPYSISIPSIIGSPLSFTQPFLATASRTSMFGRQPPSSQIRAAHIDWDSLSMAEELLGASACGGGNRNGSSNSAAAGCGGDLHLWQQGAAIDHLSFVGSANGGCGFGALQPAADRSAKNGAIHGVAGGQSGFPQRTIDPFVGPGAGLDHQSRLANYYYQQYLLQSQMHMLPPHLQSAVRQQQQLLQQQFLRQMQQAPHLQQHQQQTQQPQQQQQNHLQNQNQNQQQQQHNQQQKTNQQQQLQRQSQSQPLPQSQKQLQNQRPLLHHQQHPQLTHQHPQLTHQHQNELFPEFSPGHMAYPPAPGAVGTAVLAGIHSGGTGISAGGNPGGLIQQPHAAISEAYEAAMAQLTLASALEKQMTWEYACQRHPVISGFAVAAPLRLSTAWRWGLLCLVLASAGCVLVGTPVALMVLLAHQDTIFLAANPF